MLGYTQYKASVCSLGEVLAPLISNVLMDFLFFFFYLKSVCIPGTFKDMYSVCYQQLGDRRGIGQPPCQPAAQMLHHEGHSLQPRLASTR